MTFKVLTQPSARADIDATYLYLYERSPEAADRWLDRMIEAIEQLRFMPARHGLARESEQFDEPVRQLLIGRRPHVYRVIFIVRKRAVHVLHVRHGARL